MTVLFLINYSYKNFSTSETTALCFLSFAPLLGGEKSETDGNDWRVAVLSNCPRSNVGRQL